MTVHLPLEAQIIQRPWLPDLSEAWLLFGGQGHCEEDQVVEHQCRPVHPWYHHGLRTHRLRRAYQDQRVQAQEFACSSVQSGHNDAKHPNRQHHSHRPQQSHHQLRHFRHHTERAQRQEVEAEVEVVAAHVHHAKQYR